MVEAKQFIILANISNVCQPNTMQKSSSIDSSNNSINLDLESISSLSTDLNLLKKSLK